MLAGLYNFDLNNVDLRELFAVCNQNSHNLIVDAINAKYGTNLDRFNLDPIEPDDIQGWLEQHQQLHNDMNAALGLTSFNLNTIAFDSAGSVQLWIQLHVQEHVAAHQKLSLET